MDINQYIKENYLLVPIKALARQLDVSQTLVRGRMDKMGLVVPPELAAQRKKEGLFRKGSNPWNAGKTGIRVSPKSEFKKGGLPANTLYDGAVTIRNYRDSKTGQLRQYKYVRLAPKVWVLYQRKVWEDANGPIPKGYNVQFHDGDTLNCSLENLYIISRKEQAIRNSNREKASQTHLLKREEDGYQTPSEKLSDSYVASLLVGSDKDAQKALIEQAPEVIEAKRLIQKIKRKTK